MRYSALSIIVDYAKLRETYPYAQVTRNYTYSTHNNDGDLLYGIEIFVHQDHRWLGLA